MNDDRIDILSENTDIILFGALGDLSGRKLFPAMYQLDRCQLLPESTRILAVGRDKLSLDEFLQRVYDRLSGYIGRHWSEKNWQAFSKRLDYVNLDFTDQSGYRSLCEWRQSERRSMYYLATPPSIFATICENLGASDCIDEQSCIVLEKPIGNDLESSRAVNDAVSQYFSEENIYRIDHYLGKETVQNLLVLRFANRFINTQWDQSCVDHVQITVAETVGIEGRWSYYDQSGQLRDMVQNHLMQLLCLVAMEPPDAMTAERIRDEKVKVIRALRVFDEHTVKDHAVRGQYSDGYSQGKAVPGYLLEAGCKQPESKTETFVAIKAHIDNWRWAGVPFYLRTGKRMSEKMTEIVITYKDLPHNVFSANTQKANRLVIRLQPNEGIEMHMVSKKQTLRSKMALVNQVLNLDFLGSSEMDRIPEAYERLFLDAINGDQSLFVGREEIEEAWRWCDALIDAWQKQESEVRSYPAGSWGPAKSELLIEKDGRSWHE